MLVEHIWHVELFSVAVDDNILVAADAMKVNNVELFQMFLNGIDQRGRVIKKPDARHAVKRVNFNFWKGSDIGFIQLEITCINTDFMPALSLSAGKLVKKLHSSAAVW